MLSQFFILSGRGDTIILRDCKSIPPTHSIPVRQDLGRETCEVFYRKVNLWEGDPPPSFVSAQFGLTRLEHPRFELFLH